MTGPNRAAAPAPDAAPAGSAGSAPAPEPVVVVNVGSSSVKLSRVEGDAAVAAETVDLGSGGTAGIDQAALEARVEALLGDGGRGDRDVLVAHRFVHGGPRLVAAAPLTAEVRAELAHYAPLAPLHQPAALAVADALARRWPELIQVGCFDTAFHATLPPAATTWALPAAWRELGLRRYGFHGLSYRSLLGRLAELLGGPGGPGHALAGTGVVACHLGSGSSACALRGGRSVDTTMGLTPLGGMMMATRPGDLDPGVLTRLLAAGITPAELDEGLERHSGLVGLAGTSRMEEVAARAGAGEPEARLALDVYCHQAARMVGAMATSLPHLDAIAFTGGIGTRSAVVRAGIAARLGALGVLIDDDANQSLSGDGEITAGAGAGAGAGVRVLVLEAREDVAAADEARRSLGENGRH